MRTAWVLSRLSSKMPMRLYNGKSLTCVNSSKVNMNIFKNQKIQRLPLFLQFFNKELSRLVRNVFFVAGSLLI